MKKTVSLLLAILFLALPAAACLAVGAPENWSEGDVLARYGSDSLRFTVTCVRAGGCACYLSDIWMESPGQQIRKATAVWEESLALPADMAASVPGAALAVNGSGYVSPVFPEIPANYPGSSPDYWYTPLGSLTVTDGEIFRHLEGVPYYGLTLEEDGLHLWNGEAPEAVLARNPSQTWSFYEGCPMVLDHRSILDRDWSFSKLKAMRTVIAKADEHRYLLLTASRYPGLPLPDAADYLQSRFDPEWVYDLDGGPSSALLARSTGEEPLSLLWGGASADADLMAFTELPEDAWLVE